MIRYDMFGIFSLHGQNHNLGVFFSILMHADRGILNRTRGETEGGGGVRAGVVSLGI